MYNKLLKPTRTMRYLLTFWSTKNGYWTIKSRNVLKLYSWTTKKSIRSKRKSKKKTNKFLTDLLKKWVYIIQNILLSENVDVLSANDSFYLTKPIRKIKQCVNNVNHILCFLKLNNARTFKRKAWSNLSIVETGEQGFMQKTELNQVS